MKKIITLSALLVSTCATFAATEVAPEGQRPADQHISPLNQMRNASAPNGFARHGGPGRHEPKPTATQQNIISGVTQKLTDAEVTDALNDIETASAKLFASIKFGTVLTDAQKQQLRLVFAVKGRGPKRHMFKSSNALGGAPASV